MKITIAGQDYTSALDAAHPLTIERKLNEPSSCQIWLSLPADGSLGRAERLKPIDITGDDGTAYFTGYITASPLPEYAGMSAEGPRYRIAVQAVSEEVLLDQMLMPQSMANSSDTAGELMASLVQRSGSSMVSTQGLSLATAVNNFSARAASKWSALAGQTSGMARATYRVLKGSITAANIPAMVHPLNETDGSLSLANLSLTGTAQHRFANDITVIGEEEPATYVTEYFLGDGLTSQFNLAEPPWLPSSGRSTIIRELFNEPQINPSLWCATGGAGFLTLGSNGLAMNGGSGLDGQTMLNWMEPIEMGGTLLLEAVGVSLAAGSSGILGGLFVQPETADCCTAGFQASATPGSGAVTLQPLVQGCAVGSTFSIDPAKQYTLRVRVHCPEVERSRSVYYSFGDEGQIAAGGECVLAPGRIQMEIQQFVNGVAAMPVTLYDGGVASLPGFCMAAPASSINMVGSMRAFHVRNLGTGWVTSTPTDGGCFTRRTGSTDEAAECQVERSGKVTFYPGAIPAAGEKVAVSYRTMQRATGRAVNTDSQQTLAQAGLPPVAAWVGTVTSPSARSSADCRYAAQAMQQAAASTGALWSGTYQGTSLSFADDVWPGDALELNAPSTNLDAQVVVRSVKLSYRASVPDVVRYDIQFANDWACDLAIKTSKNVPADVWLPVLPAPVLLSDLKGMSVTAVDGSTVTINTGVAPPVGGGFEVRQRDHAFMPGSDPTLVTRSPAQNLTFSRASFADRFYVRMYDGVTPPNYSEFSAAVFVNLPFNAQ
jgi:hypothetical protein